MLMFRNIVSAIVVLFILSAADARASYLFDLTEREIDEIMSHYYPKGYDRDEVLRQMTAPFDCRNFGDLCREAGEENAYHLVETAWIMGRRLQPVEMIDRMSQQQIEALSLRWFERNYPDGVPDRDPYWGIFADEESSCDDTVTAQKGDFRVVHTSRRHSLGFFGWGRSKVEHFKRNIFGNFKPERAGRLEVDAFVITQEGDDNPVFNIVTTDTKEDAKQIALTVTEGGIHLVRILFVKGCGGVPGDETLTACSCSGDPSP
jgi:hypothetical protein